MAERSLLSARISIYSLWLWPTLIFGIRTEIMPKARDFINVHSSLPSFKKDNVDFDSFKNCLYTETLFDKNYKRIVYDIRKEGIPDIEVRDSHTLRTALNL
jgi:hypothetical protein